MPITPPHAQKPAAIDATPLHAKSWPQRLAEIEEMLREMSVHTDPQEMVTAYGKRMRKFYQFDASISLSRRGLSEPMFRVTRFSGWEQPPDPWRDAELLPMLEGGLLGELIYGDRPRYIDDLNPDPSDPGFEYLRDMRSALALPHYDGGVGVNMVVTMRRDPAAIDPERIPEMFWLSSLFGRATGSLATARKLSQVNAALDRELKVVGDIQRSLLPRKLPVLPTMDWAAHYQTSQRAGGDYYDFFPLDGDRIGILIADVAGHGTPAAVLMAILHAISHLASHERASPAAMLSFLNRNLTERYTGDTGSFVTAFYAVYDTLSRKLTYSSAGHPPPLVVRCNCVGVSLLDLAQGLPLGIERTTSYDASEHQLNPGDTLVMYTDGITEARGPSGRQYGDARLGAAVASCPRLAGPAGTAQGQLRAILDDVESFAAGVAVSDDRTLVVGKVR